MKFKAKLRKICNICGTSENLISHHLRHKKCGGADKGKNREWYCKKCHGKLHSEVERTALRIYFNLEKLGKENPIIASIVKKLTEKDL